VWKESRDPQQILASVRPLPQSFYSRPTELVAAEMIGKLLVLGNLIGRVVETEAYLGMKDRASHASPGVTARNAVMFGDPGYTYVYFIYGMYHCINAVAREGREAGAILIRALEPLSGLDLMKQRRPTAKRWHDLASGPGKLTRAMGIGPQHHGLKLFEGPLLLMEPVGAPVPRIAVSPRIGIRHCADWPLRYFEVDNPCVSRHLLNQRSHHYLGRPWSPEDVSLCDHE
jgi:DNA-3-methyladenine glycosylase